MTADENNDLELAEREQELPAEVEEKRKKGVLRTGYTTGSTATAATKAALLALVTAKPVEQVSILLPKGKIATLKITWTRIEDNKVTSAAIKDGGDDPDVTHGAEICSTVFYTENPGEIKIDGGVGVGRVTKPGLGLEMGKAAINPTPMKMLVQTINEVADEQLKTKGVEVIVSVPKGEELAKKTDNPRLGIIGGISILGTTGIVLPYSTASFAAAIRQSLDVAIAMGANTAVLTTGGRSEDFAKALFVDLPEHSFVQMGDFAGYSIKQCATKNINKAIIAGFIGKLTKMAMGIKQTHVRGSHVSLDFMADIAEKCGAPMSVIAEIRQANTARHAGEIVAKNNVCGFYDMLCKRVYEEMSEHSKGKLVLEIIMFDFNGKILARYSPPSS